jgi:NodT family efflux transporter outer membrane factor (OMF) lipoprotein
MNPKEVLPLHGTVIPMNRPVPSSQSTRPIARAVGRTALLAVAVLLAGCNTTWREYRANGWKVGPNYKKPVAAVAETWQDAADERVRPGDANLQNWWTVFNDPEMDRVIQYAYRQNLDLRTAGLRVLESQAIRGVTVGGFFPQTQQLEGGYQRNQISHANPATNFFPFRAINRYDLGGRIAWELDFWGRFRRQIESSDASLDASVENYDAVMVLLLAETADAYVQYRTAEQRLSYARQNIAAQRNTYEYYKIRVEKGRDKPVDMLQAKSNLYRTEALVPEYETSKRIANNRLCVLLGLPSQELNPPQSTPTIIPQTPPEVVVGVPAELLLRRPDVRYAERQAAAQSALIGYAESDLYPHVSITGYLGLNAVEFPLLWSQKAWIGNVGPSFNWQILQYGRLRNNIRIQDAKFQQLAVQYQQTVLKANEEAENAMVTFLRAKEQVIALREAVGAALESVRLTTVESELGAQDYNRVFNLQVLLTQEQDRLALAESAATRGLIQLYKALGGGWQIRLDQSGSVILPELIATPRQNGNQPTDAPKPIDNPPQPPAPSTIKSPIAPSNGS